MSVQDKITAALTGPNPNKSNRWNSDALEILRDLDGNLGGVADPTISYDGTPYTFTQEDPVSIDPTLGGGPIIGFSQTGPEFPAGIYLNKETGQIHGVAEEAAAAADYTIVAHGIDADISAVLNITVAAP